MTEERFLEIAEEALSEVMDEFGDVIENLEVTVERYPSLDLLREMEMSSNETLFGVYRGVPLNKRSRFWSPLFPDQIILFQGPIEDECRGREDLIRSQIFKTVRHEVGHYIGFDEDKLSELGYD